MRPDIHLIFRPCPLCMRANTVDEGAKGDDDDDDDSGG